MIFLCGDEGFGSVRKLGRDDAVPADAPASNKSREKPLYS